MNPVISHNIIISTIIIRPDQSFTKVNILTYMFIYKYIGDLHWTKHAMFNDDCLTYSRLVSDQCITSFIHAMSVQMLLLCPMSMHKDTNVSPQIHLFDVHTGGCRLTRQRGILC